MIAINTLTDTDIGRWVEYNSGFKTERGKIKSWSRYFIYVVYNCYNNWENYENYTAEPTRSRDLTFIDIGGSNDT